MLEARIGKSGLSYRFAHLCFKGGSRSGGAGGGAATGAQQQEEKPREAKLPSDVQKTTNVIGDNTYTFSIGGEEVTLTISKNPFGSNYVAFEVTGGNNAFGGYDVGGLSGRAADVAALKLRRIINHDASTRPDGFKYSTSAWSSDGFGARRAAAYQLVGFSRPLGGMIGGSQFGVVKNGKMIADKQALRSQEKGSFTAREVLKNMRIASNERKLNREGKPGKDYTLESLF